MIYSFAREPAIKRPRSRRALAALLSISMAIMADIPEASARNGFGWGGAVGAGLALGILAGAMAHAASHGHAPRSVRQSPPRRSREVTRGHHEVTHSHHQDLPAAPRQAEPQIEPAKSNILPAAQVPSTGAPAPATFPVKASPEPVLSPDGRVQGAAGVQSPPPSSAAVGPGVQSTAVAPAPVAGQQPERAPDEVKPKDD
jgi:hypothetical protein